MPATKPETWLFEDDGIIPNSPLPVLVYRQAFSQRGDKGGDWLEEKFSSNGWTNSWRWGVYSFHHYHSNTHEVLGVFKGNALLHMGGEKGKKLQVMAGDILIIPAGVGHKCLVQSDDFIVLGAHPNGLDPDLMEGKKDEHPAADQRIANVPLPPTDPFYGEHGGLTELWI